MQPQTETAHPPDQLPARTSRRGARHCGHPRRSVRPWLQPAIIGLALVAAFITCYIGLQRNPQPHRIPIAVVGNRLAADIDSALGQSADVHPVTTLEAAQSALISRDVVAAVEDSGSTLTLQVAGANGRSTTNAVQRLVNAYATGAERDLTVVDAVPLTHYDANGLAGFYVAFGVSLAGFVLAQNALGLAGRLRLRQRFALLAGFAAAAGLVAAVLAGPVLGAVPAPVLPLALTLGLLTAAAAFTTKLLGTYLGPIGIPVATVLLLTVGNATSGAAVGFDLLPDPARIASAALPPGAAVRAITDLSYFDGAHAATALLTLGAWVLVAALLLAIRARRRHDPRAQTGHVDVRAAAPQHRRPSSRPRLRLTRRVRNVSHEDRHPLVATGGHVA
ncbi:hypothetical protein [Catellatospora citrea]|uniref:ABC transporter permease n=1 Tax=Catellatospora citrea TaxID=53366 RepID=A0A8J3KN27_9ACTN|nr:hypothetical protein [Catellatospora citrea]RKE05396.1 ABC-type multidrug transport system permease subunit [Catellatospora citrea]GIG00066.1 hypothetical protein Cci01nite_51590 [Catellatospora citrea]